MKRITIDYILSLGPCYNREELEELFRGRKWVTPKTVCKEADPDDALWLLLREDFFTEKQLELLARDFREHVQNNDKVEGELMVADWPDNWVDYPQWVACEAADWAAWCARDAAMAVRIAAMAAERKWQVNRVMEELDKENRAYD